MVQKSYKDAYLQVRLCMHVDLSNSIDTFVHTRSVDHDSLSCNHA